MKLSRHGGTMLCLLILGVRVYSQEIHHTSALQIQTANIYTTSPIEETVDAFNPSIISEITTFGAQVSCSIPYELCELRQVDGKIGLSTPICHLQGEILKSGDETSAFTMLGGGISRRFHKFGIGAEYRILVHKQANSETYKTSFSRVGFHVNLSNEWSVGMAIQNIEGRKLSYKQVEVDIPTIAAVGVKWHHGILVMQAEMEKRLEYDPTVKVAATIISQKAVFGSIGLMVKDDAATPCVGVGAQTKHFTINAAMSYHNQLGITSGAALSLNNLW